jgi:hypothetical protein
MQSMSAEQIKAAIDANAQGPAKASGDSGSVEQHKLTDQIAAARFIAGQNAMSTPTRGLRFNKLVPPGAA